MIKLNYLLLAALTSLINTSAVPVINRHLSIATPSRFYLPKPDCSVIPLNYARELDKNTRPVYEVDAINNEKFTRNPRVLFGQSDWIIDETNKSYNSPVHPFVSPLLAVLLSQYGRYPAINTGDVNLDTPRVYSYMTVNNIHNNRPFGQYKWTHGFDSDPSGNDS